MTGAAEPTRAPRRAKVPLRLESGPEGALVALDVRTRQILALVGSYEAVSGGARPRDAVAAAARVDVQAHRLLVRDPLAALHAGHARRRDARDVFEGGYHPSNYEGWTGTDPLRLREALANSVNVGAVRVLARRGAGERRRVGAGARASRRR